MARLDSPTARVMALRRDLENALQRGELIQARGIRQSLAVMAIWYPEVGA